VSIWPVGSDNYFLSTINIFTAVIYAIVAIGYKGLPGANTLAYWVIYKLESEAL